MYSIYLYLYSSILKMQDHNVLAIIWEIFNNVFVLSLVSRLTSRKLLDGCLLQIFIYWERTAERKLFRKC